MENFCFQIIRPDSAGTLWEQLDAVEKRLKAFLEQEQLSAENIEHTKLYLSDTANQLHEAMAHPLCATWLSRGSLCWVEQPVLPYFKVAIVVMCRREPAEKHGTPDCMVVTGGGLRYIYHSVRFKVDEVAGRDAQWQTEEAFRRHIAVLKNEGMTLKKHCHRTWIYVRDVDVNYGGVVHGRNRIFDGEGLTAATHFIASTGIGGNPDNRSAAVGIDFFSIDGVEDVSATYLQALDYLNPTYEYGVAFERGVSLPLPDGKMLLVSGTASIDCKGQVLYHGDVLKQTERLFLNIEKLLSDGGAALSDLKYVIVYLRDIADYPSVSEYVARRFPSLQAVFLEARVCRPDWLIEVEGIALV